MARTPGSSEAYTLVTRVFSVLILGFGVAIVVVTLTAGGGLRSFGFVIGLLFTGLGAGRLYLTLRGARD